MSDRNSWNSASKNSIAMKIRQSKDKDLIARFNAWKSQVIGDSIAMEKWHRSVTKEMDSGLSRG
jgi:hypothetical protein